MDRIDEALEGSFPASDAPPWWSGRERSGRADVNQLPVMSNGRLEGIMSRDRILQLLANRAELDM